MITSIEHIPTICPYCGCGCGIYLVVKDGNIVGMEPWKDHPVCEGKNCQKGRNAHTFSTSDQRLKTPLIKKNGVFEETSWKAAFGLIADKFQNAEPDAVGFINSAKCSNEDLYVIQKFIRVVQKTNNMDNASRFCHSTTVPALLSTVGSGVMTTSTTSIEQADCIFVAGSNLQETYPIIARRVIRAKRKGARVIVVDPRITVTVKNLADTYLQIYPATDNALVNGMMRVIIDEGLEDKEFIEKRTQGIHELKNYLMTLDLKEIEKITNISLDVISEAARIYATAKRACILFNSGIAQHAAGIENIKGLADLALLTGNYGKPGTGVNPLRGHANGEGFGDMGPLPVFYPGFQAVNEETARRFEEIWGVKDLPSQPGMTYMDMVEKCKLLYVVGANPMLAAPDTNRVKKAFEEKDLLVVQDIFMTETAEMADIVLPAATAMEKDGTITCLDRRVQRIHKAVQAPGDAKPDWVIFCELAKIMGFEQQFSFDGPVQIFEEIRKCVPQYRGITYERLKSASGIQWPCPTEDHPGTEVMFVEKFPTPDGLGHFQIAEYKPPLEVPDDTYPYIFTNGRVVFHFHTGTMTRRTKGLNNELPNGFAEVNREDARELGIEDGDPVLLKSRRGEIKTVARVTDDIRPGLIFMPWHFSECAPNILTGPTAGPPSKMPEFKFCAVSIEKV
ncbi:MAG: formate dehydrogenase (coenzyme F420) alpha subunit [Desulfobacteraceae bacterium Eth-SRB2]|nr:MAG: formate dehydrogenase (coenzyme F420) alpha subunit [Desulfobacteraceae bacterium Eth-SRB2]